MRVWDIDASVLLVCLQVGDSSTPSSPVTSLSFDKVIILLLLLSTSIKIPLIMEPVVGYTIQGLNFHFSYPIPGLFIMRVWNRHANVRL